MGLVGWIHPLRLSVFFFTAEDAETDAVFIWIEIYCV